MRYRTILGVPMLREGTPIGVFLLTADVRPFTDNRSSGYNICRPGGDRD